MGTSLGDRGGGEEDLKPTEASVVASKHLRESARVKLALSRRSAGSFRKAAGLLIDSLKQGGKVLIFGNGGSAADAQHFAAELVGRFMTERRGLPAIALTTDSSVLTSISNDYGFKYSFSRQVEALGETKDVVVAITTSGASANVMEAVRTARKKGLRVIGMTGAKGKGMARFCDACFVVPSLSTPRIQEAHTTIVHILCEVTDENFKA